MAIKKAIREVDLACQQVRTCTFLDLPSALADADGNMRPIYEVGILLSEAGYKVSASALAPYIPKEIRS